MASGSRGSRSTWKADETRIAPLEDEDATSLNRVVSDATRLAPLEDVAAEEPSEAPGGSQRTMFASHAALIADRLRDKLSGKLYGRTPHRVLRIDEPEGPSTAGGRLARQSISLIPRKGAAPTIVCGWVDVSRKEAQLRSHESVTRRFEAHHGTRMDLAAADYERFLDEVVESLHAADIKVRVMVPEEPATAPRVPDTAHQASRSTGIPAWMVGVLVAAAFGLGVLAGRMGG